MGFKSGLTSAQVASAIDFRARVRDMMADPDLTGDLLGLALVMLHEMCVEHEGPKRNLVRYWHRVYQDMGWTDHDVTQYGHLWRLINDDLPRYQPAGGRLRWDLQCKAPMIRREGPCDRRVQSSLVMCDVDPDTGESAWIGFCSRHGELQYAVKARRKQWKENGRPVPPDNAGGILRRYFTGLDPIYTWANHGEELGTGEGKPPTPPRPTLTLIRGGAA